MLKRTDSAAITKANVTVAYPTISLLVSPVIVQN